MKNPTFSGKNTAQPEELNQEDLAQIFNYPSIGQLFDDYGTQKLETFFAQLAGTREKLERVIRTGSRDEADRAVKAARALEITISFLRNLQEMRLTQK